MIRDVQDANRVPCVWVVASHRVLTNEHGAPQRYTVMDEVGTRTLRNMGLQPVSFPRVPEDRLELMLEMVDGVLLGGSATHVHPSLYGQPEAAEVLSYDRERDAVAQPLLRLAIERRVPVISFCRGAHDFNVAFGGSMYQSLKRRGGPIQHWEEEHETIDQQYAERHFVTTAAGGELERVTRMHRFPVSSLHSQGIDRLGRGLVAEAHADCGLVEAFRWHDASLFAWGFQFHPEWGWRWHPAYNRIMWAYVRATWAHLRQRSGAPAPREAITA